MRSIELSEVGNSTGLIIPAEFLEKMGVGVGDYLSVKETTNGLELTPCSSNFTEAIKIAEKVMDGNRDLLGKLSDWSDDCFCRRASIHHPANGVTLSNNNDEQHHHHQRIRRHQSRR